MSRNKLGNSRPSRQTKTERLHDMCQELIGHVQTLGDQLIKLHEVVMQATAQVNVLGNIIELLKTKGIITDGEIRVQIEETNSRVEETNNRAQIEESKIEENSEVQNAKQDEGTNNAEEGCDRSEKSKSNNKIHLANGDEEPALSSSQSE